MRMFITGCLFCFLVFSSYHTATGQVDFSKTKIETSLLAGNVYLLKKSRPMLYKGRSIEWLGNIYASVGPDGILLVDNGLQEVAGKISDALQKIRESKIKLIINTHWHQDHAGANHILGREVPIIAHEHTRREMMVEKRYSDQVVIPASPREALPNMSFKDSLSIHFNDEEIKLIHFPHGHTEGDIIVFFTKSKVICMGDAFNGHFFPNTYGDVETYARNIERLIRMLSEDVKVVSGHRETATLGDLKEYHRMLIETTEIVRKKMEAGKSLAEIKAEGITGEWESWSDPNAFNALTAEQWIEKVYRCLFKKNF